MTLVVLVGRLALGSVDPCHTPHNANGTDAPLWSHDSTTNSTWQMYSNSTIQATILAAPRGDSLLCLSCHDGTVALEAFVGSTNVSTTAIGTINASAQMGSDLRNDHPISFLYSSASADTEIHASTTNGIAALLDDGYVECSSCHDVHGSGGFAKLLVMDNSGSELCLTCHDK